jgi:hypothetical protein
MSEDEARKIQGHDEEQDEVEGHARGMRANEEQGDETEGDDDVEAHGIRKV